MNEGEIQEELRKRLTVDSRGSCLFCRAKVNTYHPNLGFVCIPCLRDVQSFRG